MTKTLGSKITFANSFDTLNKSFDEEEIQPKADSLPVLYEETSNFVSFEEMKGDVKTTVICSGSYEVSENNQVWLLPHIFLSI